MTKDERKRGTLLGLAWGDVFGCPVEGWREGQIRDVYGHYDRLPEEYPLAELALKGEKTLKRTRPLGLHSDDTQQAMALISICLEPSQGWSLSRWSEWLLEGMVRGAWRGYGRNFSAAVSQLKKGRPPEQAGSASAGMGAAMRITPMGALFSDQPEQLARVVMESCLVTHGDIRASAMAYAVAFTAAGFVEGLTPVEIQRALPDAVKAVESEWLEGHLDWTIDRSAGHLISESLRGIFAKPPQNALDIQALVSRLAKPKLAKGFNKAHPNQGFVLLGGLHGLLMGLLDGEEPQRSLGKIVRLGYDTDTVAAICGGILGARHGVAWIPTERLVDKVRLELYLDAMCAGSGAPETLDQFMEKEAGLTQEEDRFQRELLSMVPTR